MPGGRVFTHEEPVEQGMAGGGATQVLAMVIFMGRGLRRGSEWLPGGREETEVGRGAPGPIQLPQSGRQCHPSRRAGLGPGCGIAERRPWSSRAGRRPHRLPAAPSSLAAPPAPGWRWPPACFRPRTPSAAGLPLLQLPCLGGHGVGTSPPWGSRLHPLPISHLQTGCRA